MFRVCVCVLFDVFFEGVHVRNAYLKHLLTQDVSYHDTENSGKLNTKLISESFAIDTAIGVKYGFKLCKICTFIFGFVWAFVYVQYYRIYVLLWSVATMSLCVCVCVCTCVYVYNMFF